nr:MAG TPA: hypothetical protein [Caudoviricetes sp.]
MHIDINAIITPLITLVSTILSVRVAIKKQVKLNNDILRSVIYSNVDYITVKAETQGFTSHDEVERMDKYVNFYKELGGDGGCNHLVERFNKVKICQ